MNEEFSKIGKIEDKVIEECSEVIQAICKINRFGLFNYHPDRPETNNLFEALNEIEDAERVLAQYKTQLLEELRQQRKRNGYPSEEDLA
jgi:hypothetical protein